LSLLRKVNKLNYATLYRRGGMTPKL